MHEIISSSAILLLFAITCLIIYQMFYAEKSTCPPCNCIVAPAQAEKMDNVNNNMNNGMVTDVQMPVSPPPVIITPQPTVPLVREYDYRTFNDPLVPPYKRSDYEPSILSAPSFATRGYPTAFKKIGVLNDQSANNADKYKFMILMGRQTYPGSNYYDYYVIENKDESSLKFDLKDLHKEMNDGDIITINELGKTYTLKVDRDLGFRYSPFLF